MKNKLRIGLLIEDYNIPAWAFKMLEIINTSQHSEIVLIVKKKIINNKKTETFFAKIWGNRKKLFFILFRKLDYKLFKEGIDAFELKNLQKIVSCSEIGVVPKETKFSDTILKNDIDKIKTHDVDVFIRLGFRILRGEILNSSKYGIWSYHHGDNKVNRGGPAGTWEVLHRWNETGVILQILTEDLDGGIKLSESISSTDKLSVWRNKNNYYWKALSLLPRKLNELYILGEEDFFKKTNQLNTPIFYYNKLFITPTNLISIKYFLQIYLEEIRRKINNLFLFKQWILLYKLEKQNKISTSFFRYKKIIPPKDRNWADPFVTEKKGKYYIFIVETLNKDKKGKISVIEMEKDGNYTSPQIVLEKDYHLSYPFLFEEDGEIYMIPETSCNNTIELYKCVDFPLKWEFSRFLMENVSAVNVTILKKDNNYFLFCNIKENKEARSWDELFIFHSKSLLSNTWISHPENPIVSDVKNSRPAGNIFSINERLYRPSQYSMKRYGHGIEINEIIELNENTYQERKIQSIYPNWEKNLYSIGTLNNFNKLTVIDALMKRGKKL